MTAFEGWTSPAGKSGMTHFHVHRDKAALRRLADAASSVPQAIALPYRREHAAIATHAANTASATGHQPQLRCGAAAFRRDVGGCSRRPDLLGRAQRLWQIDIAAHRRRAGTG